MTRTMIESTRTQLGMPHHLPAGQLLLARHEPEGVACKATRLLHHSVSPCVSCILFFFNKEKNKKEKKKRKEKKRKREEHAAALTRE